MNNNYRKANIKEFSVTNIMAIFVCIDVILLGIGLYFHFSEIYDMSRLWGVYLLILGVPGLILYGFNFIYMTIIAGGCIWLIFSNLSNNYPLAILLSCVSVGLIGIFGYIMGKIRNY